MHFIFACNILLYTVKPQLFTRTPNILAFRIFARPSLLITDVSLCISIVILNLLTRHFIIMYIKRDTWSLGIEELTVPPIEPLVIPKMQMENGHGAVRVRAILSNMTIHGASNYTVLNVR